MKFRDDDRGASAQVGAIILLGFIVLAIAGWQATVVPQDNAEVEYTHSQRVTDDVQDARNAIVSAPGKTSLHSVAVDMAPEYPPRTLFVNPGPPSGTLRTVGTANESLNVTVANATVERSGTDAYWTGDARTFDSGALVYEPGYNVYTGAPDTVYENTVLYNRESSTDVVIAGQDVVDGRHVTLVALDGNLSQTRSDSYSVDLQAVSSSSNTVAIENTTGSNVTVSFVSALDAGEWRDLLNETGDYDPDGSDDDAYVAAVRSSSVTVDGDQYFRITFEFEQNETYLLQLARVGLGSGVDEVEKKYVVDVEGDGETVGSGEQHRLVVEVRDRFNNPVSGVTVANDSTSDPNGGSLDAEEKTTGSAGRATFTFTAGEPGTATVVFNISDDATPSDNETVTFELEVPVSGSGDGAYSTDWHEISTSGVTCDDGNPYPADCTLDGNTATSVTLTMITAPTAQNASVEYALNNTSVGTLARTNGRTNDQGRNSTTLNADVNGTVNVYTWSGGSGDALTIRVTNMSRLPQFAYLDSQNNNVLSTIDTAQDVRTYDTGGSDPSALGPPTSDLDEDGSREVLYETNNNLLMIDEDNQTTTLDGSGNVVTAPIGVGDWGDDGDDVVAYVKNSDELWLYYSKNGTRRQVDLGTGPGSKTQAIAGVADFDGNGANDVVFVTGNGKIAYKAGEDGSVTVVNAQPSDALAVSTPADFDDDGALEVAYQEGTDITLLEVEGGASTSTYVTVHDVQASPMAAIDWNGDGVPDVVHLDSNSNVWGLDASAVGTTFAITDGNGNQLQADSGAGTR